MSLLEAAKLDILRQLRAELPILIREAVREELKNQGAKASSTMAKAEKPADTPKPTAPAASQR